MCPCFAKPLSWWSIPAQTGTSALCTEDSSTSSSLPPIQTTARFSTLSCSTPTCRTMSAPLWLPMVVVQDFSWKHPSEPFRKARIAQPPHLPGLHGTTKSSVSNFPPNTQPKLKTTQTLKIVQNDPKSGSVPAGSVAAVALETSATLQPAAACLGEFFLFDLFIFFSFPFSQATGPAAQHSSMPAWP